MAGRAGPLWAIVPVKGFARGKTRLSRVLGVEERTAFAQYLFEHTLHVLGQCKVNGTVDEIVVITDCEHVANLAEQFGALKLLQSEDAPLNEIVDGAIRFVESKGATHALTLMSDLPNLQPSDIDQLIYLTRTHDIVLAPDLQDEGTNALGLHLARSFPTCFGTWGSFELHAGQAKKRDCRLLIHRNPRIAFDIDSPEDYSRWRAADGSDAFRRV